MELDEWARQWGISTQAIADLRARLGVRATVEKRPDRILSEADVQNAIRLEASGLGARLWRNNVGATYTQDGSFIRFGLANDSTSINRVIKSADLIGIRPVTITHKMIGCVIGQFVSREIKATTWKYTGNEREKAQLAWAELILSLGGDACFANGVGTL